MSHSLTDELQTNDISQAVGVWWWIFCLQNQHIIFHHIFCLKTLSLFREVQTKSNKSQRYHIFFQNYSILLTSSEFRMRDFFTVYYCLQYMRCIDVVSHRSVSLWHLSCQNPQFKTYTYFLCIVCPLDWNCCICLATKVLYLMILCFVALKSLQSN